jgi:hypothetical protein
MTKTRHLAALLAAASCCAAQAELLTNGGFESPGCGYCQLGTGSDAITGWTTFLSGVEYYASAGAAEGSHLVDLANYVYGNGGIRQTFDTVAGAAYTLSFQAGNTVQSGRTGDGKVRVQLAGGAGDFFDTTFDTAVASSSAYAWKSIEVNFVATDSSTTLSFSNMQNSFTHFAFIDGASVTAVPEPASVSMMLAGLLSVGAAARRRRR